ncbi:hypothetical protein [Paenibacillus senegalensis]|uniref:hypothetical protein n=1 Tax=Paenibacillus senegalensis TaxID=1465766 RepID=UPI0002893953|nr:hypothetical protein [Paenibacillus senegalensis]
MTQTELLQELRAIGYPVAYSHFKSSPPPPYLVYLFAYNNDLQADNMNYAEISNFQIELYTAIKDLTAEKAVQDKLKELKLPYRKSGTWIEGEGLFQIMYEIQLIGG